MDIRTRSNSPLVTLLLVIIVVVAAYFRFAGLNWDENQHLHPDERFLTMVETGIQPIGTSTDKLGPPPSAATLQGRDPRLGDCTQWGGYFDTACSPLNPVNRGYGYYVYGTLPLFLVRYVAEAIQQTGYDQVNLVGRMLSALADIISLLLLFSIARRLYGEKVALLAAAFFAVAVLPIQQSHFFTMDNFVVLFVVATMYFVTRAQAEGHWYDFAAAGVALGAAAACKISIWPLAGIVTLAAVLWWTGGPRRHIDSALFKLILAGVFAILVFRVLQPYAFAGPNFWNVKLDPGWRDTMGSIQKLVSGDQDVPFGDQWTDRAPVVFSWVNMVVWGLGLPLGLAVWAGWATIGWQIARSPRLAGEGVGVRWRTHLLPWLWATLFFIYQSTQWVKSLRYITPVYPFFIMFAAYALMQLKVESRKWKAESEQQKNALLPSIFHLSPSTFHLPLVALVLIGTLVWAWGFRRIYTQPVTRVTASRWIYQNVPTAATLRYQADGKEHVLQLVTVPQITYDDSTPISVGFQVPVQGMLTSITLNYVSDLAANTDPETIRVAVSEDSFGQTLLAQAELTVHLEQASTSGGSYLFQFPSVELLPSHQYFFIGQVVQGGPVQARSSVLGNEHWDDGIPVRVDGRDGFSNYRGVELQNYNEDDQTKLTDIIQWLSQVDYINLTSNRLYASIPRLPTRYPLTSEFYRALFTDQLGFEKVAEFDSYTTIGPFQFPDQESTQTLGMPDPFDRTPGLISVFLPPAEEAFSVYDHPRVLIYHKTADFSPEKVAEVLGQVDLSQIIRLWPKQATPAPTALMLDPNTWAQQQASGAWSQLYYRNSLLNRFPLLAILGWWLLIALLGALAWPIIAFAWPGLPDRGWGLARILGLLLVAYLAWLAASLRVLTFGRGTLLAAMLFIAAVSVLCLILGARRSAPEAPRSILHALRSVLNPPIRLWLIEEAVFAFTFIVFLLIRYGNGDLWHFYLGGERPMDFAYLNAVLKSIYFPPYDPWFAGGQMNYYYFGFVIVAVPIKLLGIVPALAYNIALPMLAALTALGAFSVAFNLFQISNLKSPISNLQSPIPNPQYAVRNTRYAICVGLLAVLFVVFVGNLGELKVIFDGLAEMGKSNLRSTIPGLVYTVNWMRGLGALIGGQPFPARLDWWYWNASRIMTNGEINEFPFFTFLYSDLHAHMIAFPLTVLMLGIGLGWTLRRKWNEASALISVLVGAVVVGVARANNTWDYPTYLAIAFIALFAGGLSATQANSRRLLHALISGGLGLALFGAAWVLGGINDVPTFIMIAALLFVAGQLIHRLIFSHADGATPSLPSPVPLRASSTSGGELRWGWIDAAYIAVMGLSVLYFRPYIQHYATAYSSVEPWKGPRTPLNAYILIQGIWLFPVATYLIAKVRRLGRRWFAAALAVTGLWREIIAVAVILAVILWLAIAALGYSAILIAGPLMALAALLLIRPRLPVAQRYILLLVFMAAAITFAVEVIVLRGDIGRMNTVFKFYLQVWIICGIAAAVMIGWLGQWAARRWNPDTWLGWRIALVAVILSGLTYTFFATRAKINDRFDVSVGPTLDAMKFMTVAHANEQGQDYAFADEYKALIWMQDNIQGTPVVAESAAAPEYRSLRNRVTTYTGLPALIGYNWHEKQQRSILPGDVVDRRQADANTLYTTTDIGQALLIIKEYNVKYIMAGYPEKLYYPPEGMAKFDQMVSNGQLRVAYSNDSVTIYQVVQ